MCGAKHIYDIYILCFPGESDLLKKELNESTKLKLSAITKFQVHKAFYCFYVIEFPFHHLNIRRISNFFIH